MGLSEKARKAAMRAAGVAVATSGLSNCNNGGAVDPPPPPLECNTVTEGQSLVATGTRTGDQVQVSVSNSTSSGLDVLGWQVFSVVQLTGATITEINLPESGSLEALRFTLLLNFPSTTSASFRVEGRLFGYNGSTCDVARTFTISIENGVITITLLPRDPLPLSARQVAEIVMEGQDGSTVTLQAKTPYWGFYQAKWAVTGGTLDRSDGSPVRWTLPGEPGIYQAELLLDYGADGIALDTLLLRVSG